MSAPHRLHRAAQVSPYTAAVETGDWTFVTFSFKITLLHFTFCADHKRFKNTVRCFIISFFLETLNVSLHVYVFTCNINPLDPGLGEPDSVFSTFEL